MKYYCYAEYTGIFENENNEAGYTFYGCGKTKEEALKETKEILESDREEFGTDFSINGEEVLVYCDGEPFDVAAFEISEDIYNLLQEGEMWDLFISGEKILKKIVLKTEEEVINAFVNGVFYRHLKYRDIEGNIWTGDEIFEEIFNSSVGLDSWIDWPMEEIQ